MLDYPRNLLKDYPFKTQKIIPVEDIFILNATKITETKNGLIYFDSGVTVEIPREYYVPYIIYQNGFQIGYIIVNGMIPQPMTVNLELCDECCLPIGYDGVRSVWANTNKVTTLEVTGNLQDIGDNRLHNYLDTTVGNYLKTLGSLIAENITILGQNTISISGTNFGTTITDPNLFCPIAFDPSLVGDVGDAGSAGYDGADGRSVKDYEYDPNPCVEECYCIQGDPSCVNPYSKEVCQVQEITCTQCDLDYQSAGNSPDSCSYCDQCDMEEPDPKGGGIPECTFPSLGDFALTITLTRAKLSDMSPDTYEDSSTVYERCP